MTPEQTIHEAIEDWCFGQSSLSKSEFIAARLREAGYDLDHTLEQIGWWDGSVSDDGRITGVVEGTPTEPELWEPWARERYDRPVFVKKEQA